MGRPSKSGLTSMHAHRQAPSGARRREVLKETRLPLRTDRRRLRPGRLVGRRAVAQWVEHFPRHSLARSRGPQVEGYRLWIERLRVRVPPALLPPDASAGILAGQARDRAPGGINGSRFGVGASPLAGSTPAESPVRLVGSRWWLWCQRTAREGVILEARVRFPSVTLSRQNAGTLRCRLASVSHADRKSVALWAVGVRVPPGTLQKATQRARRELEMRWMIAALGVLGLGAGLLYRSLKRVGGPHRWYL